MASAPLIDGHIDQTVWWSYACGIDEYVEAAPIIEDILIRLVDTLFIGDIAGQQEC